MPKTTWSKLLGGALLAALACFPGEAQDTPPPECKEPAEGLLAWWRGEGDAKDTLSGTEGVLGTGISYAEGKVGQALLFTGDGGVEIAADPGLNRDSFTFESWVFPTQSDGGVDVIVCKEISAFSLSGIQFEMGIKGPINNAPGNLAPGQLAFFVGGVTGLPDDFGGWTGGGAEVPLNRWTHVAITLDATSQRIVTYVNGVLARSVEFQGTVNRIDAPLRLGARSPSWVTVTEAFSGMLDEVAIYGRALDATEIRAIHDAGAQARCERDLSLRIVQLPGLVAAGETFSYFLEVESKGGAATGVRITNRFEGLEWVGTTNSLGRPATSVSPDTLVWEIGDLAEAARLRIQVQLRGTNSATQPIEARIAQGRRDINASNDVASGSVTIRQLSFSAESPGQLVEGSGTTSVVLHLSPASSVPVSVDYFVEPTSPVSATPGSDFVQASGTAVFPPGITSVNIPVQTLNDFVAENPETFVLRLANPSSGTVQESPLFLVITDDERTPTISVRPGRRQEGSSGSSAMRFEVELSNPADSEVSFGFSTANDTARSGSDYVGTNGVVTFPAGRTRTAFEVMVLGDRTPEPNEAFLVALATPRGAFLERTETTGVILNDDAVPGLATGLRWNGLPSGPIAADVGFPATLTAVDGNGETVRDFSANITLSALVPGFSPATLKISEILWGSTDAVEFVNVSTNILSISGWRISLYDNTRWPRPRVTFVIPNGTTVNPSRVFTLLEGGSSPGLFPSFRLGSALAWRDLNPPDSIGEPMAVLVQDDTGRVVDFVGFDGAEASQVDIPVSLTEADWSGPSVFIQRHVGGTAQRQGGWDSNTGSDWTLPTSGSGAGFGFLNPTMTVPFAESAAVAVDPPTISEFVQGVWTGTLRIRQAANRVALHADDGNGSFGRSEPLAMVVGSDLGVSLEPQFPQGFRGGTMRFTLTVTNPGPSIRSGVVVTTVLDRTVTSPLQVTFPGEAPTVGIVPGTGNLQGFRWSVGELQAGTSRSLVFQQQLPPPSNPAATPTAVVHQALLSAAAPDANPFNEVARCEFELARPCVSPRNVAAWWTGDQADDNASVQWSLPGHLPAYLVGARPGPGKADSGWIFTGDPGGVRVESSTNLSWGFGGADGGVIEGWIRIEPGASGGKIPVVGRMGAAQGWQLAIQDGQLRLTASTPLLEVVLRGSLVRTPFSDGRWHHLGLSQDSTGSTGLYVDGTLVGSGTMPLLRSIEPSEPLVFGADAANNVLVGALDEWALIASPGAPVLIAAAGSFGKCLYELSSSLPEPLPPVGIGRPYSLEISVTNVGLSVAPAVRFGLVAHNTDRLEITASSGTHQPGPVGSSFDGLFGDLNPGSAGRFVLSLNATRMETGPWLGFSTEADSRRGNRIDWEILLTLSEDIDSDGIPDAWEDRYGLSANDPSDAVLDRDRDGASNRDEYLAGTDPTDPTSRLRLQVVRSDTDLGLIFRAGPNRPWVLEQSESLAPDASWVRIAEGSTDAAGSTVTSTVVLRDGAFFRVRLLAMPGN